MSGVWGKLSEEPAEGNHTQDKRQQRRQETGLPRKSQKGLGKPTEARCVFKILKENYFPFRILYVNPQSSGGIT